MKKKDEEDPLEKLMKLTRLMKQENVKVAPKGPPKVTSKWRSKAPKFVDKPRTSEGLVQAGGMVVDPARKEEYENWRKNKEEEKAYRREQAARAKAAKKAARDPFHLPPA